MEREGYYKEGKIGGGNREEKSGKHETEFRNIDKNWKMLGMIYGMKLEIIMMREKIAGRIG